MSSAKSDALAQIQAAAQPQIKCDIKLGSVSITIAKGDITTCDAVAIVNSTNERLENGGDVSNAIFLAGDVFAISNQ